VSRDKSAPAGLDPLPSDTAGRGPEVSRVLPLGRAWSVLIWRKGFVDIRFSQPCNEHGAVWEAVG